AMIPSDINEAFSEGVRFDHPLLSDYFAETNEPGGAQ
ncbi:MAG: hypothetical protein JWL90_459, partial [Chthoniobacteraceae bacterium]|nr:hypothetical protein [Chthoniobacteraceae bacterium]